jgi:multimeric flavodoxin WrbA
VTRRTGQADAAPDRAAFGERFRRRFFDPAFDAERDAIARLEVIAWCNLEQGRKAPHVRPAGAGYADPTYELSDEWRATREKLDAAQQRWHDPNTPSRVLVVCGSARNDGTCPGEVSKTWRLSKIVEETLVAGESGPRVDLLDLSRLTSDYDLNIHPCKGCVSTAMPLCHWPCSCYPNHALGQSNDWMAEIYERFVAAHGVVIVAPTYWYQSPSPLKLMMDRLVCADGGNPDPTTTHGKKVEEAKAIEDRGWDYPQHLAGRVYGVVVHGDVAGFEAQRRALCDWLDWMGFVDAGFGARIDRAIGYYEPYSQSHEALDRDAAIQAETRNVALAVANAVRELRAGRLVEPGASSRAPRPK